MASWAAGLRPGIAPNRSVALQNLPTRFYGAHRMRLIALILGVALVAIVPAGHASPPDPSWIGGLYDNGDFDDVVLLITSTLGAIQPTSVWSSRRIASAGGLVTPTDTEPHAPLLRSAVLGRAPPLP